MVEVKRCTKVFTIAEMHRRVPDKTYTDQSEAYSEYTRIVQQESERLSQDLIRTQNDMYAPVETEKRFIITFAWVPNDELS